MNCDSNIVKNSDGTNPTINSCGCVDTFIWQSDISVGINIYKCVRNCIDTLNSKTTYN